MKKILLGSIAFFLFSISIALLQTSCGKNAIASPVGSTQLNKIVFWKYFMTSQSEIWLANYDGLGLSKINPILPNDCVIVNESPLLSPDGKIVFFVLRNKNTTKESIYSCKIDGSEVTMIYDGSDALGIVIGGAY